MCDIELQNDFRDVISFLLYATNEKLSDRKMQLITRAKSRGPTTPLKASQMDTPKKVTSAKGDVFCVRIKFPV